MLLLLIMGSLGHKRVVTVALPAHNPHKIQNWAATGQKTNGELKGRIQKVWSVQDDIKAKNGASGNT